MSQILKGKNNLQLRRKQVEKERRNEGGEKKPLNGYGWVIQDRHDYRIHSFSNICIKSLMQMKANFKNMLNKLCYTVPRLS